MASEAEAGAALRVLTVGHSSRSSGELLALLVEAGVETLVDVRRFPSSRRHPQFRREALERELAAAGLRYVHEVDLGGHRKVPKGARDGALDEAFRGYAAHMRRPAFDAAVGRLLAHARRGTTAAMCAEADPSRCHRSLLADYLTVRGVRVEHLRAPGERRRHALDPRARVGARKELEYPARSGKQLDLFGG